MNDIVNSAKVAVHTTPSFSFEMTNSDLVIYDEDEQKLAWYRYKDVTRQSLFKGMSIWQEFCARMSIWQEFCASKVLSFCGEIGGNEDFGTNLGVTLNGSGKNKAYNR